MYLIIRKDKLLTHIGIYIENYGIVHYASLTNNFFGKDKVVKKDNLASFSLGRLVRIIPIMCSSSKEDVISKSSIFPGALHDYHIIHNNCYTFVFWCLYGKCYTRFSDMMKFAFKYKIPMLSFLLV